MASRQVDLFVYLFNHSLIFHIHLHSCPGQAPIQVNWTSQFMQRWNRPRALRAAGTTLRGSGLLAWAWPGHLIT